MNQNKGLIASDQVVHWLRMMILIRKFEEKLVELYPEQEIRTPVHLYIGQEAVATGVCSALSEEDYIFTTHRSHGHYLAKGGDVKALMAELYGKETGCSRGHGGSMHVFDLNKGILGSSGIVAGSISLALGSAMSSVIRDDKRVSVCFFGDGAVEEGVFSESLNLAALYKLPVLFVCENNRYATNSELSNRQPLDTIYKRADAFGIPGKRIDGNDVFEVYQAAAEAVRRARDGEGPSLLECMTYRWKGHVGPGEDTRDANEVSQWKSNCPITKLKQVASKSCQIEDTASIENEINCIIDGAVQFAKESVFPKT